MTSLLLTNATCVATFDDAGTEITDGAVYIDDHVIRAVGPASELPDTADRVIDLRDHIVLPGLINTHHHLYQSLTRGVAQNADLLPWLKTLYPMWGRLTDEGIRVSTLIGLAELMLSGCTTSSDHHYLFPNDCTLDTQIRAACDIGMRFHAARGAMTLGESDGGMPPDALTENEDAVLADMQRLLETYHDPSSHAMQRIALAPSSPFAVTESLMRNSAALARENRRVGLHTHLAETLDEEVYCLERYGLRPLAYTASLGWTGDDVWHAHCVHLNADEVRQCAASRTGVAHCPTSNMRLASGIAPLADMLAAGVRIGLGVDGSASNDSGHLLAEARQAMLLQRVAPVRYSSGAIPGGRGGFAGDPAALSAREALRMATRGGAETLGRDDIGAIAAGMSADLVAIDLNRINYAGAGHDPLAAVVFCQPSSVDLSIIHGRVVVEKGVLQTLDIGPVLERHRQLSRAMVRGD